MKKLIVFILCISLLCAPSVFAEDNNNNSIEVLNALNIGNFSNASETVTRGDFISAVSDILNYDNRPVPTDGIFSDVTSHSEYSGAVYDAYGRGLISGFADGTFGANSPILYEHAVKILVSALGYDNMAKNRGGYPSGYMVIASQEGILSGVSKKAGDNLNAALAARLIENAMNTEVFQQVIFGSESEGYQVIEGDTMLSVYAKIKKVKGLVYDNGITSLEGSSTTHKGSVVIGSEVYKKAESVTGDFLGYKVEAYVSCKGDSEDTVLYMVQASTVKTAVIPANRLLISDSAFSTKNIVYEDVYGNKAFAKVDPVADFIYNGKAYLDLKKDDLDITFGEITLIDNNSDNIYDVVLVNESEIFTVAGVSEGSQSIYKKSGDRLSLDKSTGVQIYRDGVKAELSAICEWDVINAFISLDKSAVTLYATSKKIAGKVESVSKSDRTVCVDGKYFHVINDDIMKSISVSSEYEFCLDMNFNIAGIKSQDRNSQYIGIVTDSAVKEGIGSCAQVRIFSSIGNHDVLDISEKATIDGYTNLSHNQQVNYIKENMTDKLVYCQLDGKGRVMEISLPYKTEPASHQNYESLRADYSDGDREIYCYGNAVKNFDGKVVPGEGCVVFLLPHDRSEYESYSVTDMKYFNHSNLYNILAYSIGAENGFSEYIVCLPGSNVQYTNKNLPVVVEKVTTTLNDEGMAIEKLVGYSTSGEVKAETKYSGILTSAKVNPGDIIRYKTDIENKIIEVEKIVDGVNVKQVTFAGTAFASSPRLMLYDVYYRYDNLVGCTTNDLSKPFNAATINAGVIKQTIPSWVVVYEVDTKRNNTITQSSYDAIRSYQSVGTERSKIFVYSYSGSENMIVIYN